MFHFYNLLHSASDPDSQDLLSQVRTASDHRDFVKSLGAYDLSRPAVLGDQTHPRGRLSAENSFQSSTSAATRSSYTRGPPSLHAQNSSMTSVSLGSPTSIPAQPTYNPLLPEPRLAEQAVTNFYDCIGRLFYVSTREHGTETLRMVYGNSPHHANNALVCELFSIIAIGCQYSNNPSLLAMGDPAYERANDLFDDALHEDPVRAMRTACCMAMYNIMHKSTTGLSFLGQSHKRQKRADFLTVFDHNLVLFCPKPTPCM